MSCKTCSHVMEDGHFCQSPAVSKREYCYHHMEFRARRVKMARARSRGERWWLDLPNIEDMRSCQAAVVRVGEAIAARLVEPEYAKLLLAALRLASSNFRARNAWKHQSDYHVNGAFEFVGKYPGFEAVHDLPADLDLDADPLKLFPMPVEQPVEMPMTHEVGAPGSHFGWANPGDAGALLKPSVGLSESFTIPETTGPYDQVTAEDMELNDIVRREGEQAMLKRAHEFERNHRRRERQARRKQFEAQARNRNLHLAAQKLVDDQQLQAKAAAAAAPVANHQSPATSAVEVGVPSRVPSLGSSGVEAAGGILGEEKGHSASRADGPPRKPPQTQSSSAATTASKGGS